MDKKKPNKKDLDKNGYAKFKSLPKHDKDNFSVFDIENDLKVVENQAEVEAKQNSIARHGVDKKGFALLRHIPTRQEKKIARHIAQETKKAEIEAKRLDNFNKKLDKLNELNKKNNLPLVPKQKPKPIAKEKPKEEIREHISDEEILKGITEEQGKIEKNKRCGTIERFDKYLAAYENSKCDFTVVSYGMTRKIMYGKYNLIFNGSRGQKKPVGTHLISIAKKDLDALIDSGAKIPKIPKSKPYLQFIHHKNLDWFGTGQQALAIDANHCYWRTAYLKKFITEETYLKGTEKKMIKNKLTDVYKEGRLIAIGTWGKIITVAKYKAGVKVAEYPLNEDYIKYGGYFWEVISKVYEMMIDLWQTLKEDFLMYLTDCVVIDPARREDAIRIMEKHGYSTKEYGLVFTEITDTKVCWVTDDGTPKFINHNANLFNKSFKNNLENKKE